MKTKDLHSLIQQHIPKIQYLELETSESVEAECAIWQQDDCTLIIDFENKNLDSTQVIAALQNVSRKLAWLDAHRADVLQTISTESKLNDTSNTYIQYAAFLIESADDVFCDFALAAPQWGEQTAACSLEEDNELIFHGIETN